MSSYDSRPDTHEHIAQVRGLLNGAAVELIQRGHRHDRSKLVSPEVEGFDEFTPKLAATTYGSAEYEEFRAGLGESLAHHYAANDHHPEHHSQGIDSMDLIQLLEMLCDWIAATRRHDDGDIHRSIDINAERFGYDDTLRLLLHRSVGRIEDFEDRLADPQPKEGEPDA